MKLGDRIDHANREAVSRMVGVRPILRGVFRAGRFCRALRTYETMIAGPPIPWSRTTSATREAFVRAALFEGWVTSVADALELGASGSVELSSAHDRGGVAPGATAISPGTPVFVVEDGASGRYAFAAVEEPPHPAGAFDPYGIDRLRHWSESIAPALDLALRAGAPIEVAPIVAKALVAGDDLHAAAVAGSALFVAEMVPRLFDADVPRDEARAVLRSLARHDRFFIAVAMAASKLVTDAARAVDHSTVVTAMASNGADFGVRLSGTGARWFTSTAPEIEGRGAATAEERRARLVGDEAILETCGLGAMVLAGAPAALRASGVSLGAARELARSMARITIDRHARYMVPALDFEGAPAGIDARKVLEADTLPAIYSPIFGEEPPFSTIGAGIARAPRACFLEGIEAFARERGVA